MPGIHPNTSFDPADEGVKLVRLIEAECLDESQVGEVCAFLMDTLKGRAHVSKQRVTEDRNARLSDSRRSLIAAKVKGVRPAPLVGGLQIPQGLVPSRA